MKRLKVPNGISELGYGTEDIPSLVEGSINQVDARDVDWRFELIHHCKMRSLNIFFFYCDSNLFSFFFPFSRTE